MVHARAEVIKAPSGLDQVTVAFDEQRLLSDAGLLLTASLAERLGFPTASPHTARTRRRLFQLPGRLTRAARQWTLRMPARWRWQTDCATALTRIRAYLPMAIA